MITSAKIRLFYDISKLFSFFLCLSKSKIALSEWSGTAGTGPGVTLSILSVVAEEADGFCGSFINRANV